MKESDLEALSLDQLEQLLKGQSAGDQATGDGPPLVRLPRDSELFASPAEERLWFLTKLADRGYHISEAFRLTGALNTDALRSALSRLVERQEVLRTTFAHVDGKLVRRITAPQAFSLEERDLRNVTNPKYELDRLRREAVTNQFDLAVGPLIRGLLIRLTDTEGVLVITMHHMVSDAWSVGVLVKELGVLYSAAVRMEADQIPLLDFQYADYAAWHRNLLADSRLQEAREFWRAAMANAPLLSELPTDRPRPPEQNYEGGVLVVDLDAILTQRLKALSQSHGLTLYMTLLSGWAALMSRLSGQSDIILGSPVANRTRVEVAPLIGFFVNTLPVRCRFSTRSTITQALELVKEQVLRGQRFQDVPLDQIVEVVNPNRSAAFSPLFQVMFSWVNDGSSDLDMAGLSVSVEERIYEGSSLFDLTLSLGQSGPRIVGALEYSTALFDPETIQRYWNYYRKLLEAMADDPYAVVSQIELLDESERQRLLVEWNATVREYPKDKCIHSLFEEQVARRPEAIAVVCEGRKLTYAELNAEANRLAHHLRRLGVGPDTRVGICIERSVEMVVGVLAVLKAGGAYVPLDAEYPAERLVYMVADSAPKLVLTHSRVAEAVRESIGDAVPLVDIVADAARWADESEEDPKAEEVGVTAGHLAYVIYTSGSTGRPKGVQVGHQPVMNLLAWAQDRYCLNASDVVLQKTSIGFDVSICELFWSLSQGAKLILARPTGHRDTRYLIELIVREQISTIQFVPSMLDVFLGTEGAAFCTSLRRVLCAGESLPVSSLQRCRHTIPSASIYNLYGPTETAVYSTAWACSRDFDHSTVPIGHPIANTTVYVLDEHQSAVPVGVVGELYIGGAGVARGYVNRPELTAERFVPDPFAGEPGARMYRSGDLGRYRADGNIEFVGRNDDQVKIRGFRIELGEIQARLSEHAGVGEVVVIAREDTPGNRQLVAYYTEKGGGVEAEELRAHVLAVLPEYMVPAAYVRIDELPLTTNGKLDRKALPAPDEGAVVRRGYEAPRGEVEEKLAKIWSELLQVERVGRQDNFFELGGHSLLAVSLIERMRREGLHAKVSALFTAATLSGFATAVSAESGNVEVPPNGIPAEGTDTITAEMLPLTRLSEEEIGKVVRTVEGGARNVQDIYPLTPLQEGILFHHLLAAENDPYILKTVLGFDSRERLDGYVRALQAVIERHDILRTAVVWEGLLEPMQVVWRKAPLHVEEVELGEADGEIAAQLQERFDPRHNPFDLGRAPLIRMCVAKDRANGRWLGLQVSHHLIGDQVTMKAVEREIESHLLGKSERLSAPVPLRNFVAQARRQVSPQEHETFFRQMLEDVDESTAPFGLIDVRGSGSIVECKREIEARVGKRLRQCARSLGVSAASVCHLAWG